MIVICSSWLDNLSLLEAAALISALSPKKVKVTPHLQLKTNMMRLWVNILKTPMMNLRLTKEQRKSQR